MSVYREILAAAPQNCAVKNNLAELLGLQRLDLEWALSLIQETIQVLGPQPCCSNTRATINLARGNSTTAIDDMQLVVAAAPRPNRYFHLATALQAAGRSAEAPQECCEAHALGLAAEHLHRCHGSPWPFAGPFPLADVPSVEPAGAEAGKGNESEMNHLLRTRTHYSMGHPLGSCSCLSSGD